MAETTAKKKPASRAKTTTKKTTTTKTKAAKETEAAITEAVETAEVLETPVESTVAEEKPTVSAPVKRTYNADDLIECRSVRYGLMRHISTKSGNVYEWGDFGDVCDVTYGDLLSLKARKSRFITNPWFIIMDDQLVAEWKLTEIYSYFEDFDDVEEFLTSGAATIRRKLPAAPQGYKDLVVATAGNMIRGGRLDSIATIKAIDDILGKNLSMLIGGR